MVEKSDFSSCYLTGGDLLTELQTSESGDDYIAALAHAYGYIAAVVDAHFLFSAAEDFPAVFEFPKCDFGQIVSLIYRDLDAEPELLDGTAASLIVRILQRHFPSNDRLRG
ncbi:Rap1a/Tai family immunity protein [Erythrobacter ani]|uniref:Rap1a immunity protein domain-containing protein n=1 Tax=Erythrobacter ani TaxID=2827235 RepID=A0ABS6SQK0_9SPHN|nr:Rap1a/Tai family immunity protein [Erythrobacter ani]MBV7267316.1 hypothetical protein [Erythrobacter ani]